MPQTAKRRRSTASRARAANRARTALPQRRRQTRGQVLARRGTIILGVVIVVSLIVALAASYTTSGTVDNGSIATSSSPNDPSQLIAAVTANPNNPDLVRNLADYYDQTGQYQNELILDQQYSKLRPDDADGHTAFGELLANTGDLQGAQSQFTQAIALKPTDASAARAHLGLANVDTKLQPPRYNDALSEYQMAASLDPSGNYGNQARVELAALQQQLNVSTVTVIAPGSGSPAAPASPNQPSGTP